MHFMRSRIAENEFIDLSHFKGKEIADERYTFDKKFLHSTGEDVSLPWNPIKFAIFRPPIERAFSEYKMITRWNAELTTSYLCDIHAVAMSGVENFFSSDRRIIAPFFNAMTQHLVGERRWNDWLRETSITSHDLRKAASDNLLDIALKEISNLDIIFDFDNISLVSELSQALSQSEIKIDFNFNLNTFNSGKEFTGLSSEEITLIESCNKLDKILFEEAARISKIKKTDEVITKYAAENDTTILDFSREIPANNIFPREVNGRKNSIWTGNNGDTSFYFRIKSQTKKWFCMLVTAVLNPAQMEGLVIKSGDDVLPWRHCETKDGFLVICSIEKDRLPEDNLLIITISTPVVASPSPSDPRILGLEISGASMIADSRPW